MSLLCDLVAQKLAGLKMENIYIYSDGSTDQTVQIIRKMNNPLIKLISNKKRHGLAHGQNQLFKSSNSDILVLLQADIMIDDTKFLEKLIKPLKNEAVDLVSANILEMPPANFFESTLQSSMAAKRYIFAKFRNGNNVYTCHGPARAFSKQLYKKMVFGTSVGEDAYSYLYCIFHGYKYTFVQEAKVYYRLPNNLADHQKQSIRYIQSQKKFIKDFGKDFVGYNYHIPFYDLMRYALPVVLQHPMHFVFYSVILGYTQFKNLFHLGVGDLWQVSASSKRLRKL